MNILVVFTYGYSIKTWFESGTLNRELSIYKNLSERFKINFTFLTYGDVSEYKFELEKLNIKVVPIYEYLHLSNHKLVNYFYSFLIPFKLKNLLSDVSLIKQNQLHGVWVSIILKYLIKKPLFVRTGYDMYLFSIYDKKKALISFLYKILTMISLKVADLYSVTSRSDYLFIKNKYLFRKDKLVVRPNWILNSNPKSISERYEDRVVSIGRLESQKNFELLRNIFANTHYQIDIIGVGSERNYLEELSKLNNVTVNFLGNKKNEEIIQTLKKYKYYFSTSKFEGNPKSLLEALATNCLVFATDIDNHKEIIENGVNGYLFSLYDKNYYKEFSKIINNIEIIKKVAEEGFKTVIRENSIDTLTNKEFEDYKELINSI